MPTCNVLMRVSLIAEACDSLRLTLELFCSGSYVALVLIIAMLNKIVQKKKHKSWNPACENAYFFISIGLSWVLFKSAIKMKEVKYNLIILE